MKGFLRIAGPVLMQSQLFNKSQSGGKKTKLKSEFEGYDHGRKTATSSMGEQMALMEEGDEEEDEED